MLESVHICRFSGIWVFSDFEFKIRLIRLVLSFQKQKILDLNSQPIDYQPGVMTITPKSQLWVGDTEKLSVTFSGCLTETWIHLILLIKLVQYKIGKTPLFVNMW